MICSDYQIPTLSKYFLYLISCFLILKTYSLSNYVFLYVPVFLLIILICFSFNSHLFSLFIFSFLYLLFVFIMSSDPDSAEHSKLKLLPLLHIPWEPCTWSHIWRKFSLLVSSPMWSPLKENNSSLALVTQIFSLLLHLDNGTFTDAFIFSISGRVHIKFILHHLVFFKIYDCLYPSF